jgi:hypothetical protein
MSACRTIHLLGFFQKDLIDGRSVSELQREAVNLLLAKHGLAQIAKRWTPDD